jgi:hypothetical protein
VRINKWLLLLISLVFVGCTFLDKITGIRVSKRPPPQRGHPAKHHPTPVRTRPSPPKPTPGPTGPAPRRSPGQPETISKQQFDQSKSELDERSKNEKQIASFVGGLRKIANDDSITAEKKQAIFSEIIANAKLTGRVKPEADALNSYYQDPSTGAADRQALDASLTSALSKMARPP